MGALTGHLTDFVSEIKETTDVLKTFVQALNPAAVQMFDQAFKNVLATIGQALLPVLQTFTNALQGVAAILDGPMKDLGPVFEKLAGIISGLLVADAQQLGAVLTIVATALDVLAPLIEAVNEPIKVSAAALAAFAEVLKASIAPLKPIIDTVAAAFKDLLRGVVVATAYLVKFAGFGGFLDQFIAALEKQNDPGRVQNNAPQNLAVKGLEQITKDLATSAALAGAGEKAPTQDQFLGQLVGDLKAVKNDARSFQDVLHTWLTEDLPDKVGGKFREVFDTLKDKIVDAFEEVRRRAGNWKPW